MRRRQHAQAMRPLAEVPFLTASQNVPKDTVIVNIHCALNKLLCIVGDAKDYFISGSLSFLPLLPDYREPIHDVDVAISIELFQQRKAEFEAAGQPRVLRISEIAIAKESLLAGLPTPKTKFVHVETNNGLIDIAQYQPRKESIELFFGCGLTLRVPNSILERVRLLDWKGLNYRAGPPELALLPKMLCYHDWKTRGTKLNREQKKHLADLKNALSLVDWQFSEMLIAAAEFRYLGRRLPNALDRQLNPFRRLQVARMKEELKGLTL